MSDTIKLSELNIFPSLLTTEDFFPIDKSSSLLTYRATLGQLKALVTTGSFSGSLIGTSSWANNSISSSYVITSSHSRNSVSASYSLTASYVSGSGGSLTGTGTNNYLPIWTGNTSLGNSNIFYTSSLNAYLFSYANAVIENGQAFFTARGTFNCGYTMQSMYTSSDAWMLVCGTENSGSTRGLFDLATYSGSNQLISKQGNDPDGNGTIRALRIASNGIYIWPLLGAQSVSRDGTFNVGVDSGVYNTSSRLLIDVFSGSSASNPQTYHLRKAIEVRYGSGSSSTGLTTTFCVSSSGKTYIGNSVIANGNLKLSSPSYLAVNSPGDIISVDAEKTASQFIQLSQNGTASVTMSAGQSVRLLVHQGGTYNLHFTGSIFSGSSYWGCPIVWQGGSSPTITQTSGRVDMITMHAFDTSTFGPSGASAVYNTVIYAMTSSNFY
jgi:hypothetical protein